MAPKPQCSARPAQPWRASLLDLGGAAEETGCLCGPRVVRHGLGREWLSLGRGREEREGRGGVGERGTAPLPITGHECGHLPSDRRAPRRAYRGVRCGHAPGLALHRVGGASRRLSGVVRRRVLRQPLADSVLDRWGDVQHGPRRGALRCALERRPWVLRVFADLRVVGRGRRSGVAAGWRQAANLFRQRIRSAAAVSVSGMVVPFVLGCALALWLCERERRVRT